MNWQVFTYGWGRAATENDDWSPPEKRINRIYYIHGGKGFYEAEGELRPLEHNKLYVLPDTIHIQVSQDRSDPMDHTFFDFDMVPGFSFKNMVCIDVTRHPMIKSMLETFQEIIRYYKADNTKLWSTEVLEMVNSLLPNLLWMISKVEDLSFISDTRIKETLKYILDNLHRELTVEELSARVFLEKNYFIRLFAQNTGRTPHAYIRNCRMHYAVTLLRKGLLAKTVAQQCGYESYCAFSRAFKAYYGCPPTEFLDTIPRSQYNG